MAELLGIVAGGAGLASLALQLIEGGQRLRHRYKQMMGLQDGVTRLSEDLEVIGKHLIHLEASSPDVLREQLGPVMLERCRSRSASVATRLARLTALIPGNSPKRRTIRAAFQSSQWKGELDELQSLVAGLNQDISLYAFIDRFYTRV
ncbi:hypothetical protein NW762_013317 [Fusarium torreyae]|uniref:Fungal N-terminal domain-containing protein n=1 Tax=Fusarium torreyae TaxID=1237075 RepID=A0A9W8V8V5_9HYPO|nr:hypothetical protein NW762_013317 [Fusarium torreyae]